LAGVRGDAVVVSFEVFDAMALVCCFFRSSKGESIESAIVLCCVEFWCDGCEECWWWLMMKEA